MAAKVTMYGRLTKDVESKDITNEGRTSTVLNYTVACNTSYRKGNEYIVSFIPVVQWVKQGDGRVQYLKKGTPLFVSGELLQESWQDKEGNPRSKLVLRAENIEFGARPQTTQSADTANPVRVEKAPDTPSPDAGGEPWPWD